MQALEDRTEKSRREMDLHDTIDTVRVLNARNQHIDIDKVLECTTSFWARTFFFPSHAPPLTAGYSRQALSRHAGKSRV
jgi:hypothetical protein